MPSDSRLTRILLIENCANDAHLLKVLLASEPQYSLTIASRLSRGISLLVKESFDLVLLGLGLPDCEIIEALSHVQTTNRLAPIVVLHDCEDENLAIGALRKGAQDYLVKKQIDRALLLRVLRYACERHSVLNSLQSIALTDPLTGLFNRHGFTTIGEEQLKLARRTSTPVALAFVDLDGMKRINDELGHQFGDQALVATAHILKSTFRASDLIARLGGDEFVILGIGVHRNATDGIRKRLMRSLAAHNKSQSAVTVGFSVGFACHKPSRKLQMTLEQLMIEADQAMYIEKQTRRSSRALQAEGALQIVRS